VEGRKDLEARVVRTVGDPDVRFKEDHLRLLRAVRFASTLGFSIEPRTADAIVRNAALLGKVSADRIREELTRILLEAPQAGSALLMLNDLALLPVILPEVAAMKDQRQPEAFHPEGDVLTHTVLMLNMMKTDDRRLAYSVLLHDVGKPPTAQMDADRIRFDRHAPEGAELARRILERLRFSNEDIEAVTFCVGNHMRFMDVQKMRASTLRRLVGAPTFPIELELHRLDCLASHKDLDNYRFVVEFQEKLKNTPVLPKPWVTGEDIMSMGVPEGCEVGRWRKIVYDAQLEGKFADRSALLDWLREQVDAAKRGQTLPRGEP
jgi:poly(A) polymerase